MPFAPISGVGLGLRRGLLREFMAPGGLDGIDFLELAPENWLNLGGKYRTNLQKIAEEKPIICHGLSLDIGGQDPLDFDFLKRLKVFLTQHNIQVYSEHLSYSAHNGHLYDLMPLPFTDEAVVYVSERIRQVQDFLERPLILENISYYLTPPSQMTEIEFINAVLGETDCQMLLDINNVGVNAINQCYDAHEFLDQVPAHRIAYAHIAGHAVEAEDLRIDTHGAPIIDETYHLAATAYKQFGMIPTLVERDFNLPPLAELKEEVAKVRALQQEVCIEA